MLPYHSKLLAGVGGLYKTRAITLDGTNDYIQKTSDLSGNSNGKTGLVSFWIKMGAGSDGTDMVVYQGQNPDQNIITRNSSNILDFSFFNTAGSKIMGVSTSGTITVSDGWTHVLCAWDLASTTVDLYIDGVLDETGITATNDNIDYTKTNHTIGDNSVGIGKLDADIADLYINFGETLDISSASNRAKFLSNAGKPVDLGDDGSWPTGTSPIVFLKLANGAAVSTFATNKGTGGGFAITGTLTEASTSPSD